MSKIPLRAQASAIENVRGLLRSGAKPNPRERELLDARLAAAVASLNFIEGYEVEFREFIARRNAGAVR
jgi:hypothetical protein